MGYKSRYVFILLMVLVVFTGCTEDANVNNDIQFRNLKIIGDVANVINLGSLEADQGLVIEDNRISLSNIIKSAEPFSENHDILIVGNDGLMAKINGEKVDDCSLEYIEGIGWCSITEKHPVSTKIKDVKEIVVISKDIDYDYGFNIFTNEKNIFNITPGQLYLRRDKVEPYIDGESKKTYEDTEYGVTVLKDRRLLDVEELISEEYSRLLALGANGDYRLIDGGYLELFENKINFIDIDTREYIKDIKGILVNPPATTNMDLYYDTMHYLEEDKVLAIFVDGLGFHQYLMSTLCDKYKAEMANTVYKPVTNAGFAAMISGKAPYENGILNRDYRELKTETIFDVAEKMGKKTYLVEANLKILNTSIDPILNLDSDGDSIIDDQILDKSIELFEENPDFMMIHFHSIDDFGHKYGDISKETLDQIELIAEYIRVLKYKWKGKIIITSDHGMHSVDSGGYHGSARYEDIIIPYIITEGDKYEKE